MGHQAIPGSTGVPNIALYWTSWRNLTQPDEIFHVIICKGGP